MHAIDATVSDRVEHTIALVNGLLVMVLPLVLVVLGNMTGDSDTGVTVRPPGSGMTHLLMGVIPTAAVLVPFAALAAWRSSVYARRWREYKDRGWRGVAESGACGLAVALVVLLPGLVMRPQDAPPYLIAYGGSALVAGVVVGLFLRATAIVVLKLHKVVTT